MSRILSRISMLTGQISSHALHDVHAQISSGSMRSNTESALILMSRSSPTTGDTRSPSGPVAAITLPTFSTISRGSRGFPVAWAGQKQEHPEDRVVLGPRLAADAVGASDVAAGDGPRHADREHHAHDVGEGAVALVRGAVEELPGPRELLLDLADDGDDEQADEPEVDERVHDARRRVAQQGLHVEAVAEVL